MKNVKCKNQNFLILSHRSTRKENVTSERKEKRQADPELAEGAVVLFSEGGTFLASAPGTHAFGHFCSKSVKELKPFGTFAPKVLRNRAAKKYKKALLLILIILFIYVLSPSLSFAQSPSSAPSLKVTPIIIPLQLSPGKLQTHKIELENLSTVPLPLRAQFSDFEQATEDGGYVLEQGSKSSLASWITLSEKEFILSPKEKKTIELTIQAPATIPVGGYYSLLFFQPVTPQTTNTTKITSRIGILILGDIGIYEKEKQKADILTFGLGGMVHETPTIPLLLRVQNVTLHHLNVKAVLSIEPFFGTPENYPLEEKYIFPGKVRRWTQTITLNNFQPIGLYNAVIKVSTGNGEQVLSKTVFLVFPITKTLILIFIIAVGIFTYKKRKQLTKAGRILLGKEDVEEKVSKPQTKSPRPVSKAKRRKKK